jgi:hypothetical protein
MTIYFIILFVGIILTLTNRDGDSSGLTFLSIWFILWGGSGVFFEAVTS